MIAKLCPVISLLFIFGSLVWANIPPVNLNNYLCRVLECDSTSFQVCEVLANSSSLIVLAQKGLSQLPSRSVESPVESFKRSAEICECCVRRDQNPIIMREKWLEAAKKVHEMATSTEASTDPGPNSSETQDATEAVSPVAETEASSEASSEATAEEETEITTESSSPAASE